MRSRTRIVPARKISAFIRSVITQRWSWRSIAHLVFAAIILSQLAQGVYAQEIVVNPSVQEKTLTRGVLRAIFSMRLRTWPDGSLIQVFVLSDNSPLHVKFSKSILNIFPYQLRRTWDRLVYSGTGQAPLEVESINEMAQSVASTPGAIGYLPEGKVNRQVRKIQVIQAKW